MPSLADLAVIIPVGPGDTAWRGLLPLLQTLPDEAQIVLTTVDGDAQSFDALGRAQRVSGAAGRGRQLNAGVAASQRRWLWFLHADSRFDDRALRAIARMPDVDVLAYFGLRFHPPSAAMRVNAFGVWFRSRLLRLPFGDQGFLIRRERLDALGGFDDSLSGGEDHALVWVARRAGLALRALPASLSTSARKYRQGGWWRTTGHHLRLTWRQAWEFSGRHR